MLRVFGRRAAAAASACASAPCQSAVGAAALRRGVAAVRTADGAAVAAVSPLRRFAATAGKPVKPKAVKSAVNNNKAPLVAGGLFAAALSGLAYLFYGQSLCGVVLGLLAAFLAACLR